MNRLKKTTLSLDMTHFRYYFQVLSIQTFSNIYILKQYIKINDQTINMWISTKINNNNNIILKDSLESLHQRVWFVELPTTGDFSHLLSKEKWMETDRPELHNWFLQQWLLFASNVPLFFVVFFIVKETNVFFLFICFTN